MSQNPHVRRADRGLCSDRNEDSSEAAFEPFSAQGKGLWQDSEGVRPAFRLAAEYRLGTSVLNDTGLESHAARVPAASWRFLFETPSREPLGSVSLREGAPGRSRFHAPVDRRSPRAVKTDGTLRFFHDVLGLDYLHYGLWEPDDPRDITGLRAAQLRYAQHLISLIPERARTVLDVGSGTGRMAQSLRERGLSVEGLSPDPYQAKLFARRVGAPFHLGRFQEFWPERPYDLVLMSESSMYVWLESLFPAVLRAGAGGHLLVADYFSIGQPGANGRTATRSGHPLDQFLAEAERHRLVLEHREDVTERVLPTLSLASGWLARYVSPTMLIARDAFGRRHWLLLRVARFVLRRRLEQLEQTSTLLDPDAFRRSKRYELLRFRVPR